MRENNDIQVQGKKVPDPVPTWKDAKLSNLLEMAIEEAGYVHPTSIQMQAIPIGRSRRDMIGIAPTGLGKSCAFLVPMIDFLLSLPRLEGDAVNDGPYCMILAPTRELAI